MRPIQETDFRNQAQQDGITHLSTGVAVWKNNKILIIRRAAADYLGGQYELPGGGVDNGETLTEAAIREVKEETGLNVSRIILTFRGFDYSTDRKPRVRQINFLVQVAEGEVALNPEEHDAFLWADADTELGSLMSADMQKCVAEAVQLASTLRLYLFTLEIDRLQVGRAYNTLPSHLTLVSRFWSELSPEHIAEAVNPLFFHTEAIELSFGEEAVIGPKETAVHLLENTADCKHLHMQLLTELTKRRVAFNHPQFIGESYVPHVSRRDGVNFAVGQRQTARCAYLIEIVTDGTVQHRNIRKAFDLAG